MNRALVILLVFAWLCTSVPAAPPSRPDSGKSVGRGRIRTVHLKLKLPKAMFKGVPVPINEPNVAKPRPGLRKLILVPKGTVNLAFKKPVTSNEPLPVVGDLEMVTDGDKSGEDGHNVDIGFGKKWVQIDLKMTAEIYAIAIWHYHGQARVYRDVIVDVANDPDFVKFTRVFNSDHDNSYGQGIGNDMGYVETSEGKVIRCKGVVGRYVRLHSQGNTSNDQNHYIEVEVYGIKARPRGKSGRKAPPSYKTPLRIEYPRPMFKGIPVPMNEPNVARPRLPMSKRSPLLVPAGTINLALKKPVTSNESRPVMGKLSMVTDGDKSGERRHNVNVGVGRKWVQIDLQATAGISAISIWHYHTQARVYRDVIVRVSNDPDFVKYATIFNNDHDNSCGLGIGKDKGYVETSYGKLIACIGTVGRYVRLYSNGNTTNAANHYVEVEVYGRELKGMTVTTKPADSRAGGRRR